MAQTIDRCIGTTYIEQLRVLILADLSKGRWQPGQRMLTEERFQSEYVREGERPLSRIVVRKALQRLEADPQPDGSKPWTTGNPGRGWLALRNE